MQGTLRINSSAVYSLCGRLFGLLGFFLLIQRFPGSFRLSAPTQSQIHPTIHPVLFLDLGEVLGGPTPVDIETSKTIKRVVEPFEFSAAGSPSLDKV